MDPKRFADKVRRRARNYWPAVLRGARLGGERARSMLVARSEQVAFDRGGFARGWKWQLDGRVLYVFNQMPYAGVVEYGRRPNRRPPPVRVILPWVRRKVRVSRTFKSGKRAGQTVKRRAPEKEMPGIAFLIARAIGRRGIKGKFVLRGMRRQIRGVIHDEIREQLRGALRG